MVGILVKNDGKWFVKYLDEVVGQIYIPIHPKHNNSIGSILAEQNSKEIEFEIIETIIDCKGLSDDGCFMDAAGHNCGCQEKFAILVGNENKES